MFSMLAKCLTLFTGLQLVSSSVQAASTYVAVASNFTAPAKEIAKAFQAETGHKAVLSFGSTGKLYAQILNGAPYEVFLSADVERARLTEENPKGIPDSRFTYAIGKLALYPAKDKTILKAGGFQKLAIANPKTAPYGKAALEILKKLDVYDAVAPKLVRGENIAQTYQFVVTRNAQIGFVALSQVVDKENKWVIPEDLYTPIKQDVVLLKKGGAAAQSFYLFLKSETVRSIIKRYGYDL